MQVCTVWWIIRESAHYAVCKAHDIMRSVSMHVYAPGAFKG